MSQGPCISDEVIVFANPFENNDKGHECFMIGPLSVERKHFAIFKRIIYTLKQLAELTAAFNTINYFL